MELGERLTGKVTIVRKRRADGDMQYILKTTHTNCLEEPTNNDELQILQLVGRHQNLIRKHHSNKNWYNGNTQILLEYINGRSLNGLHIQDEVQLSRVANQILEALTHIHKKSIAHMAIQPDHVLVNPNMTVKLCSFGHSKIIEAAMCRVIPSLERAAVRPALPNHGAQYLSPEAIQAASSRRGLNALNLFQQDVWGTGMVVWELFVGHYPLAQVDFSANLDTIHRAITDSLPLQEVPGATEELIDFLNSCLNVNAQERSTVATLHSMLLLLSRQMQMPTPRFIIVANLKDQSEISNSENTVSSE
ncbi:PREDICTED: mitogen-activated protein kinase kinase 5-like [Ipomoea nil]|uniref:mitogen-activated protein kinase kinase 5-like n=1 Tax=Ipomoea nil TaxID=35883 RepID=UPI0009018C51|nr:PREDICTED: mitogen-activated protein kinase kinase 5-like [Ipomoea nil]